VNPRVLDAEAERVIGVRLWSALILSRSLEVAESILHGRPVMVRNLDPEALRRARRGMPAPAANTYIRIRHGHLDAIAECGPLTERRRA
jgi:hypothetical protein